MTDKKYNSLKNIITLYDISFCNMKGFNNHRVKIEHINAIIKKFQIFSSKFYFK